MKPEYYFIFCPNNSGTTVMSQYLAAQTDGYLPPYGYNEGQMAPTVKSIMRSKPWNADAVFDWPFIRNEWDKLRGDAPFIEASPPNIMRVADIRSNFHNAVFLFSISNPYLHISSCISRYERQPIAHMVLEKWVAKWIVKAKQMQYNVRNNPDIPTITYEEFCKNPKTLNDVLGLPINAWTIAGKGGSGGKVIRDRTYHNALFLTEGELQYISDRLNEYSDLVSFFGYVLETGEKIVNDGTKVEGALHAAIMRRMHYELRLLKRGL